MAVALAEPQRPPWEGKLPQGVSVFFVATCRFDDGMSVASTAMDNTRCVAGTHFQWSTTDARVVSAPANATGRAVTASSSSGTANVVAASGVVEGSFAVVLGASAPGFVFLEPDGPQAVRRGTQVQAKATARYANTGGGDWNVTDVCIWTSSNASVATVGASNGLVAVPAAAPIGGMANVTATFNGMQASGPIQLTVAP